MTPAFDRDGYPTEWTLEAIESWPAVPRHDWYKLLNFMQAAWRDSYGRVTHGGRSWEFITGGWSGNESIIAALRQNIEIGRVHV